MKTYTTGYVCVGDTHKMPVSFNVFPVLIIGQRREGGRKCFGFTFFHWSTHNPNSLSTVNNGSHDKMFSFLKPAIIFVREQKNLISCTAWFVLLTDAT